MHKEHIDQQFVAILMASYGQTEITHQLFTGGQIKPAPIEDIIPNFHGMDVGRMPYPAERPVFRLLRYIGRAAILGGTSVGYNTQSP